MKTATLRSHPHLHPAPMSSTTAVAEDPRRFSMPFTMPNFSLPIPRPITWAVSALVDRLRRIDEATALPDRNTHTQPVQETAAGPQRQPFQQMPVPWTFLTSGYFIGFLIFVRFITLDHYKLNPMIVAGSRLEQNTRDSQSATAWSTSTWE